MLFDLILILGRGQFNTPSLFLVGPKVYYRVGRCGSMTFSFLLGCDVWPNMEPYEDI